VPCTFNDTEEGLYVEYCSSVICLTLSFLLWYDPHKCSGIILNRKLSWADKVNYTVQKAWKALHFITYVLKNGNSNPKSLAYKSLVCLILEYGSLSWDLYREGQINVLDHVQKKEAKFANHMIHLGRETLLWRRKIACICAISKHALENRHGHLQGTG
jgi:hypothetical protein